MSKTSARRRLDRLEAQQDMAEGGGEVWLRVMRGDLAGHLRRLRDGLVLSPEEFEEQHRDGEKFAVILPDNGREDLEGVG